MRREGAVRDRVGEAVRGVLFGLLLLTPIVFTGSTLEAFETPKVALLQMGAIGLAALGFVWWSERGQFEPVWDAVRVGAIAFGASAVVSTMMSISPLTSFFGGIESLAGLTTVLAYLIVLLAARRFVTTAEQVHRLMAAPVIAAGLAAVYALVQAVGLDPYPWQASSAIGGFVRPFATLGHANLLGGYLVMALPLAVYLAMQCRGQARYGAAAVAVISVVAIVLTLSRGAWLSVSALAVMGAAALVVGGQGRRVALAAFALVGLTCLGWWSVGVGPREAIVERLTNFADGAGRLSLWRAGMSMAASRPMTGVGLDAYAITFGRHRPTEYWLSERNTTPTRAHNEIVQVLATQGAIGCLALAILVMGVALAICRAWAGRRQRALTLALTGGLLAFAMQGMFGFTVAATGSLAAALVGVMARIGMNPVSEDGRGIVRGRLRAAVALVAAGIAWVGVVEPLLCDVQCRRAECLSRVDPIRAVGEFERAVEAAPHRDLYWFKLAQGARNAAKACDDPTFRQHLNARAREAQQKAVDLVPEHPLQRAHLARLLTELAAEKSATEREVFAAYEAALARDPRNPGLLAEAGHAAWSLGQPGLARNFLRRGMELDPGQANLRALSGLVAMAEGHFEEAEMQFQSALWSGNWHGNEDGQLQALTVWAACLVKLNRPIHAEQAARIVVDRRPDWPGPRYTLGYALGMLGRKAEAAACYQELIERNPEHPLAGEAKKRIAVGD